MDHCGTGTLQPTSQGKMADRLTKSPLGVAQHRPVLVFPLLKFLCSKFCNLILRNKALVYFTYFTLRRNWIPRFEKLTYVPGCSYSNYGKNIKMECWTRRCRQSLFILLPDTVFGLFLTCWKLSVSLVGVSTRTVGTWDEVQHVRYYGVAIRSFTYFLRSDSVG